MPETRLFRLGRYCATRPYRVLLSWLLFLAVASGAAAAFGGDLTDDILVPGSPAERGNQLIAEHYPGLEGASAQLVFHSGTTDLTAAEPATAIADALARVRAIEGVTLVSNPFEQPGQIASTRDTVYADVLFDRTVGELGAEGTAELSKALQPARDRGVEANVGGELAFATSGAKTGLAEVIGVGVAIVILLVIFGSVIAAGLPLLVALCSLGITVAAVSIAASLADVASEAPQVAAMIGLGVGIDYALILVTRHREGLAAGTDVVESIATATALAGRSVLFAGGTVVIAVCALFLTGLPLVISLGASAAVVVAVSVAAALTLLPALMKIAGKRVVPRRRHDTTRASNFWMSWTMRVARRPILWLTGATAVLIVLVAPLATIELTMPDTRSTAVGSEVRRAHDLVEAKFGAGATGPLFVVAETGPGVDQATAAARLTEVLRSDSGIAAVTPPLPSQDGKAVLVQAIPQTAPSATATEDTVERVRGLLDTRRPTGGSTAITGSTATYVDFSAEVRDSTVLVVGVVVGFCALLLLMLFRSTAVAIRAAVVNLLSISAAFGVVVVVFQWGWGNELLGVTEPTPIASFVPLFMFAVVFGLSMDYEVFLIARIREETLREGGDTQTGLARGMASTAQVITSAALIMISVFTSFALAPEPVLKLLGLGLAVAVLLDATIVRLVLLPAAIALLGNRTWRLPSWLDRLLPQAHAEPQSPQSSDAKV